ncbi:unnamed protein product [Dracunculus medinensis]|uniref:Uncharacterized protein n=1 Tax=Dracunculus medinensis TaxID=318479 RepID=A0A158Q343_DRAME|nr:unnamed protein product [Dracunculus medinensis]
MYILRRPLLHPTSFNYFRNSAVIRKIGIRMTANGDIPESLEEINLKMNATTDEVGDCETWPVRVEDLKKLSAFDHLVSPLLIRTLSQQELTHISLRAKLYDAMAWNREAWRILTVVANRASTTSNGKS